MSLVDEQAAFLLDITKLIIKANELGFLVTGKELQRSIAEQKQFVKEKRSKTLKSNHLNCTALDLYFFIKVDGKNKLTYDIPLLKPLGDFWESLNPKNRWGGNWRNFKDIPHFERNLY